MQVYAEEAVNKQLSILQAEFNGVYKKTVPWKGHEDVLVRAQRRSDRYISLKQGGSSENQIKEVFAKPVPMKVFSYRGDIDTILTPMDSIKYYLYFLSSGFMSMDPKTGYIKAWVGGVDHRYFKVDHVNPNTKRQPGSTFKPFTYAFAIDNGVPPCAKIPNQPVVFEEFQNWSPKNADGKVGGEMTLKRGLALSVNLIVANLLKQFGADGPKNVIDLCKRMGVTSELLPYPSLCLGAFDVSVYEMVGAYSTFANKGVWTEPVFLIRIEDKNGKVVIAYQGTSGAAINAELEFDQLFKFFKTTSQSWIKKTFKINTYLFGDIGVLNYNYPMEKLRFGNIRSDAGVGTALTIKKWGVLQKVDPLTIRFDMPLFLNRIPATETEYVKFRWILGISRAF